MGQDKQIPLAHHGGPGEESDLATAWLRRWRTVLVAAGTTLATGAVLVLIANTSGGLPADIRTDLTRAGVGLAVTAVLGILATAAFKDFDLARVKDQERRRIFREVVDAYNDLKAGRRRLRALGFPALAPPKKLAGEEVKELRAVMIAISEIQLRFEALQREVSQSDLFKDSDRDHVAATLRQVERYISTTVVKPWEQLGPQVWEGARTEMLARSQLSAFTGHKDASFQKVSRALEDLTAVLHWHLFGGRRPLLRNPIRSSPRTPPTYQLVLVLGRSCR